MGKTLSFYIKTFGCQANTSDSERFSLYLQSQGNEKISDMKEADIVVINSCIVRESAENRIYGLIHNLNKMRAISGKPVKIILTGCLAGFLYEKNDITNKEKILRRLKGVDEIIPINRIGFDNTPQGYDKDSVLIPISSGCNNICSYCIVPYTRGREISRSLESIISQSLDIYQKGGRKIILVGQNVNSYGSDLLRSESYNALSILRKFPDLAGKTILTKPTLVQHMGKRRIPTLFPLLLDIVSKIGFEHIDFISSNPWDFSEDLIRVIASHTSITRTIHLPLQSGDDMILKAMNRFYTASDYISLIKRIRQAVPQILFTTDIIVGFPGESDEAFEHTWNVCNQIGFVKAYINQYSPRIGTLSASKFPDDVSHEIKESRWLTLNKLINT